MNTLSSLLKFIGNYLKRIDNATSAISANEDLNNYTSYGRYTCTSSTVAETLGHAPTTTSGFVLEVKRGQSSGYTNQMAYVNVSGSLIIYARRYTTSSTTWTDWENISSGIQTKAKGGTGVDGSSVTANRVLASPNGSNGAISFRALVTADIPSLAASKITSGTFDAARIPSLSASKITSDTLGVARLPQLLQKKAYTATVSIPANGTVVVTATDLGISSVTNYTPVAAVYFATSNDRAVIRGVNAGHITGSMVYVSNVSSSTLSDVTVSLTILFARNEILP